MTEEDKQDITLSQSTISNALVLAIFALVSVSATALTWILTKDRIQSEKEQALLRAIDNLIPRDQFANDPYTDCIKIQDAQLLGSTESQQAWRLRDAHGNPVGVIISSVAPNGYTGPIEFIAGYKTNATKDNLAGIRVTAHQETPGLGDKIETRKSDWIYTLSNHPVDEIKLPEWQVTKDGGEFDAFTGATITPRALLQAITNTTAFYKANKEMLYTMPSNCVNPSSNEESESSNE